MTPSTYFLCWLLLPSITYSLSVCDELDITFLTTPDSITSSLDNMKIIMQNVMNDGTSDSTDYNLILYGDNVPASLQHTIIPIYNPAALQDIQVSLQQNADSALQSTKISASDAIRTYKQNETKPFKPYLKQQRFKQFADHNYAETQYIVFADDLSSIQCDSADDELNVILMHNVSTKARHNINGKCGINIFFQHDLIQNKKEILRLNSITCSAKVLDDNRNEVLLNHNAQFVDADSYILCDINTSNKSFIYVFYDDEYAKYKLYDYYIVTRDVINDLPDSCKTALVYQVTDISTIYAHDLGLERIESLDANISKQLNDSTKILKMRIQFPHTMHEYIFKANIKTDQKLETITKEQLRNRRLFVDIDPSSYDVFYQTFRKSDSYITSNVDISYFVSFSVDINVFFEFHWDFWTGNQELEFRTYGEYSAGFNFDVTANSDISRDFGDLINYVASSSAIWIGPIPIWVRPYLQSNVKLDVLASVEISGTLTCNYAATYNEGYKYTNINEMTPGYGLIGENLYFNVSSINKNFGSGYTEKTCAQSNYYESGCEYWAFRASDGSCHCIADYAYDIISKSGWDLYKMGASCGKPTTSCEYSAVGCGLNGFELKHTETQSCTDSSYWYTCYVYECVECDPWGGEDVENTYFYDETIHETEIKSNVCEREYLLKESRNNDVCDTLMNSDQIGFDLVIEPVIGMQLYEIIDIYSRVPITNELRIQPIETDPSLCGLSASVDMCTSNSDTVYTSFKLTSFWSLYFGAAIKAKSAFETAMNALIGDTSTDYNQYMRSYIVDTSIESTIFSNELLFSYHFKTCLQMIDLSTYVNNDLLVRCCGVTTSTTTTTTTSLVATTSCNVANPEYINDGWCDGGDYNTAECDYDGGDCCESTCQNSTHICGANGYNCINPFTATTDTTTTTYTTSTTSPDSGCNVTNPDWLSDGICDEADYNTAECGYDGGDCCELTCDNSTKVCGKYGYNCINPFVIYWGPVYLKWGSNLSYVIQMLRESGCNVSDPLRLHDGSCDTDIDDNYNTAECFYDLGDCCEETCLNDTYICGSNGYNCINPYYTNSTVYTTNSTAVFPAGWPWSGCSVEYPQYLMDGYCDGGDYNTAECLYDGGDCCEEACQDSTYSCGHNGYNCIDPTFANTTAVCNVDIPGYIGDGYCDYGEYNTEVCNYDGGDCCKETCRNSTNTSITCGENGFECLDPAITFSTTSQVFTTTDDHLSACTADESTLEYIGDGYCDWYAPYNTEACDYDGGDCCEAACKDDAEYSCGSNGYYCIDPLYLAHECNVTSLDNINDGWCNTDGDYNTEQCRYDGGDCCELTCQNSTYICGSNGYNCTDPLVTLGWYAFYLKWGANLTSELLENGCDVEYPLLLNDGRCDDGDEGNYNINACQYDGGDCCEATCQNSTYICGSNGYNCADQFVASGWYSFYIQHGKNATRELLNNMCDVTVPVLIGNGFCNMNSSYNTEACSYDLGDCCAETCVDGSYICGSNGYDCIDPHALTTSTTDYESTTNYGSTTDAITDANTTAATRTTTDASTTANTAYTTSTAAATATNIWRSTNSGTDPSADVTDDLSGCNVADSSFLGNGRCDDDDDYNTEECNYDGGDCCEETCKDSGSRLSASLYECGSSGYNCIDPSVENGGDDDDDDDTTSGNKAFQFSTNISFAVVIISVYICFNN